MTRLVLFGSLLAIVAGCTNPDKIPQNIIPAEKMEKVLWDMLQADRFSSQYITDTAKNRVDSQSVRLYHQVFALHGITKKEFAESFEYYLSRPDITRVMFDSLALEAERMRPKLYQQNP